MWFRLLYAGCTHGRLFRFGVCLTLAISLRNLRKLLTHSKSWDAYLISARHVESIRVLAH